MTLRHYPGRTVAGKFVSGTAGIAPTPEVSRSQATDFDGAASLSLQEKLLVSARGVREMRRLDEKVQRSRCAAHVDSEPRMRSEHVLLDPRQSTNPKRDWPFLSSAIDWARHNGETLQRIHFILAQTPPLQPVAGLPIRREATPTVARHEPTMTNETAIQRNDNVAHRFAAHLLCIGAALWSAPASPSQPTTGKSRKRRLRPT